MAYVIKETKPGRLLLIVITLITLWLASSWLAFDHGQQQASFDSESARSKHEALQQRADTLARENREIKARIAILERSAQVESIAKAELTKSMQAMQEQEAELQEELAFFRGIVSPEKGKTGLNVYDFRVVDAREGLYHYKLLLTQATKNDRLAEGVVSVKLTGVGEGREKTIDLSEISVPKETKLVFKFRYFQDMNGSFQLPSGFKPRTVEISLLPSKPKKAENLVKTFDWSEIMVEEG
jgi:cell division protein FtsB